MNVYQKVLVASVSLGVLIAGYFHPQIIMAALILLTIEVIFNKPLGDEEKNI